jgi:hypothetical protein
MRVRWTLRQFWSYDDSRIVSVILVTHRHDAYRSR